MIGLYYHGGSANHGCEAIVRSTYKILNEPITLFSSSIDEEKKYGVDNIVNVEEDVYRPVKRSSLRYIDSALYSKIYRSDYKFIKYGHRKFLDSISKGDICLSIGGDNYCYAGTDKLGFYNRMLHEKGAKTVLWGCSIEPSALTEKVIKDLKKYDLITVRESLSFEGLQRVGIRGNVRLCSDPAFQLEMEKCDIPEGYGGKRSIGINVSPLAAKCGNMVLENYEELIRYILQNTDYKILLIPHVVKPETDDRQTLAVLLNKFVETGRIVLINDCTCMKLKYIISQCKMFIGARTHATIAAYSTGVPTLVVGYSIKARGIAKDIFGMDENYVIPVQSFRAKTELVRAFIWLSDHEEQIRDYLNIKMPEYCWKSLKAGEEIQRLNKL